MAKWRTSLLLLVMTVTPSSSTMVTDLPGGGHVEVETGSRGEVCMYITDDWGTIESTQCTSTPGTYTLTGRGGGQARVTVSEFGGVSINTGYFREVQSGASNTFGAARRHQPSEEEKNSIHFGSYENPRPAPQPPTHSASAHVARRLPLRPLSPALRRFRPTARPTVPPVRVPYVPRTVRPTFQPLTVPPATEAGLGAVEILASGPGQLTVFGSGFDTNTGVGAELTGPSAAYPTPESLVARKKRNRLSATAVQAAQPGGGTFTAARSADGSTVLNSRRPGHRFTSVHSNDGSSVLNSQGNGNSLSSVQSADGNSVLNSQQGGNSLSSVRSADGSSVLTSQRGAQKVSSVQSADGSSVITSQTAGGQRLGLVRSPDGSEVFSTFIDGRLVNVVRSSDGSSVVSTNIEGRQVTALTSPAGQRLIAGAGPGHNLDAFFNRVMLQLGGL